MDSVGLALSSGMVRDISAPEKRSRISSKEGDELHSHLWPPGLGLERESWHL